MNKLFRILENAFNNNREGHILRNQAFSLHKMHFLAKGDIERINKHKEICYQNKIKYLKQAIKLIEEEEIDIEYGLKDDILFFQYKGKQLTFHTYNLISCKKTDIVWDGIKNQEFPFKYINHKM